MLVVAEVREAFVRGYLHRAALVIISSIRQDSRVPGEAHSQERTVLSVSAKRKKHQQTLGLQIAQKFILSLGGGVYRLVPHTLALSSFCNWIKKYLIIIWWQWGKSRWKWAETSKHNLWRKPGKISNNDFPEWFMVKDFVNKEPLESAVEKGKWNSCDCLRI